MRRPLEDITVVAVEQAVAAPFATRQLADLGARVIKIERPGGGDFARRYDQTVHGESSYFVFATNTDRVAHDGELTVLLEQAFAAFGTDEVIELLEQAGIANARLRTPAEFTEPPQLTARDRLRPVDTPGGVMQAMLPPVVGGWEPAMGAVPRLGWHTAALRAEFISAEHVSKESPA